MADTFTIYSKKKFRFTRPPANPDAKVDLKSARDLAVFETKPNEVQEAPVWIRDDNMFKWASADGDIRAFEPANTNLPAQRLATQSPGQQQVPGQPGVHTAPILGDLNSHQEAPYEPRQTPTDEELNPQGGAYQINQPAAQNREGTNVPDPNAPAPGANDPNRPIRPSVKPKDNAQPQPQPVENK